jgi:hypothetical protein
VSDEVKIAALRVAPPFSFLSVKPGDELLRHMVQYDFDDGDVIIQKGDIESTSLTTHQTSLRRFAAHG